MSTIFNAVQCFQCSTMQVKQQKKSSNEWTCVICNEKQSLRKVFARGFIAKDVRIFVQTFNMSRHFAEQQRGDQTLDPLPEDIDNQLLSHQEKRRTDWSEYIDMMDNHDGQEQDEQEDLFGPSVATDSLKALFKKPKLNTNLSGFDVEDGEKGFCPVFPKRNPSRGKEQRKFQPTISQQAEESISAVRNCKNFCPKGIQNEEPTPCKKGRTGLLNHEHVIQQQLKVSSNWSEYIIEDNNKDPETIRGDENVSQKASKWDNYLTQDDDNGDLQLKIR